MQRTRIMEGSQANDPSHRWALDTDPEVRARNRYANVQAWANSRIHLRVPEGECDFINASPITLKDSVSQEERKYIATQVNCNYTSVPQSATDRTAGTQTGRPLSLLAYGFPRDR